MFTTLEQDKEFNDVHYEIGEIYRRPDVDGNFQPVPAVQKQKTKDFLAAVAKLAKLATEIANNNERTISQMGPEEFSKLLNSGDAGAVARAKARADATLFKKRA